MATTLQEIARFLGKNRLRYRMDADSGEIAVAMRTRTYTDRDGDKGVLLAIRLEEDGAYLKLFSRLCYVYKHGPNKAALLQTCLMISYLTKLIQFEYDADDGEVRAIVEFPLEDAPLTERQLMRCILDIVRIIDAFDGDLRAAMKNGTLPASARDMHEAFLTKGGATSRRPPRAARAEPPSAPGPARRSPGILARLAKNITAREATHPVLGRDREIEEVCGILLKLFKPNPILVGEPGVGKSAVVEALAQRIRAGQVPEELRNKRLYELQVSHLLAGTGLHGAFEERMRRLIEEVESHPDIILFLDEIHQLVRTGSADSLADILKPALARGCFRCIGATTTEGYYHMEVHDEALLRRFHVVRIDEPDRETTQAIVAGLAPSLEAHHRIAIPEPVRRLTVSLCAEFLPNRRFPDKALDVLDRASTMAALARRPAATENDVRTVLTALTGVTSVEDSPECRRQLDDLDEKLRRVVLGQDDVIRTVANAVRVCKHRLDLRPMRPDGVFLFLGPPGVGKTALAAALARCLTGREDQLIHEHMSDYSESHSVSRLIGSPPGYDASDKQTAFARRVQQCPCGVLLLDEFDRAHADVHRLFLQVFDEGRLSLTRGGTLSLSNLTVIATADIESQHLAADPVGFGTAAAHAHEALPAPLLQALKTLFPPELLHRFDEILVFRPMTDAVARQILLTLILPAANERVLGLRPSCRLELSENLQAEILRRGFSRDCGVRELQHTVQALVLNPLAQQKNTLVDPRAPPGAIQGILADWKNGKTRFSRCDTPPAPP